VRERAQRGGHGVRARVVGVVDDDDAGVGAQQLHAPPLGAHHRLERRDRVVHRDAELVGDRERREGVHDVVLAEDAQRHGPRLVAAADRRARAVDRRRDVVGPQPALDGVEPEPAHARLRAVGHPGHAVVVVVEDRDRLRGQVADELVLRPLRALDAAELAGVREPHLEHDRDVGHREAHERRDVALAARAELEHEVSRRRRGAQHRHGCADLVVERLHGAHGLAVALEDRLQHVLRRGLAVRARDADDGAALAHRRHDVRGESLQGGEARGDDDVGHGVVDRALAHDERGTRGDGGADEAVAVGDLAGHGDEDVARLDEPRVGLHAAVADACSAITRSSPPRGGRRPRPRARRRARGRPRRRGSRRRRGPPTGWCRRGRRS
jgi:hypothetical protein